jgi:hypothetical protein
MIVKGNNPNKPIGRIESQQPHFGRHPDLFLLHLEISHFCEDASLSDGPEPSGNTYQGYRRVGVSRQSHRFLFFDAHEPPPTPIHPYADPCPPVPRTLLIDNSILPLFHRGSE